MNNDLAGFLIMMLMEEEDGKTVKNGGKFYVAKNEDFGTYDVMERTRRGQHVVITRCRDEGQAETIARTLTKKA